VTNPGCDNAAVVLYIGGFDVYTLTESDERNSCQPERELGATAYTRHKQGDAAQSKAEPKTQNPHTGLKTGPNQLGKGLGKPVHRVRLEARIVTCAPDRHRDALPRHRASLSSRSAPEMKAGRERPGPPACTAFGVRIGLCVCEVAPSLFLVGRPFLLSLSVNVYGSMAKPLLRFLPTSSPTPADSFIREALPPAPPVLIPDAPVAASAPPDNPAPSLGPVARVRSPDPLDVPPLVGPRARGDVLLIFPRWLMVGDVPSSTRRLHPTLGALREKIRGHCPGRLQWSRWCACRQVSSALPFMPVSVESFGRLRAPALTLPGDLADQAVQAGRPGLSRVAFISVKLRELSITFAGTTRPCAGRARTS
jgi:hypothetical protein